MISRSLRCRTSVVFACLLFLKVICSGHIFADREDLLIEAEAFEEYGGWGLDTQFIRNMGSPYLIAHGLGKPVQDAKTQIKLPKAGTYRVYVRTKDWVARWNAPGQPGRFQVVVDGKPLTNDVGTEGAEWHW